MSRIDQYSDITLEVIAATDYIDRHECSAPASIAAGAKVLKALGYGEDEAIASAKQIFGYIKDDFRKTWLRGNVHKAAAVMGFIDTCEELLKDKLNGV